MVSRVSEDLPPLPAKAAHDLSDFARFLEQLSAEGFEFAVIGGCAVVAYASLLGEEMFSADLDIYVTQETMSDLLTWAPRNRIRVIKRPRPRNIPVAFLEEPDGKEINVLTASSGLPKPEIVVRNARQFILSSHGDLEVPLADPFDLLSNKLAVRREKDLPHIEVLRRFVDEESVTAFVEETRPRARLAPARRLLEALGRNTLPRALADRLLDVAKTEVDYRFLMGRVPTEEQAKRILERMAEREDELSRQLESILATRRFEEG
ncbi:MAG: hypothetical protein GY719_08060 [bacterium]|nr:hypothetical protein [bacterium]